MHFVRKRALVLVLQALAAIFFIVPLPAWAQGAALQPVPALDRAVIDRTGTLSAADAQALEARLQALQQARGTQVVVLLVPSTAPEDIAAYANRVGNAWKIGRRAVGDGVLVIVAKDDRRMRIEVAKALEGTIPDIAAARIIDGAMKPRFQQGDYAGGLMAAVAQLDARIAGDTALPGPGGPDGAGSTGSPAGVDWADLAIFLFVGVMVGGPLARSLLGGWWGGVALGAGVGALALAVTASALLASAAALMAALYTWMFSGGRRASTPLRRGAWGGAAAGGWSGMGGWSAGAGGGGGFDSGSGGGGFSSGGGGDFGGGGASGDW